MSNKAKNGAYVSREFLQDVENSACDFHKGLSNLAVMVDVAEGFIGLPYNESYVNALYCVCEYLSECYQNMRNQIEAEYARLRGEVNG